MTLQELEKQLAALSPIEKAEAIRILTQSIGTRSQGITKTPGVCGGEACIANTRLPVWLFVSYRQQGSNDAELLSFYPQITIADLVNVWAYAEAHSEEIQAAIARNEAA